MLVHEGDLSPGADVPPDVRVVRQPGEHQRSKEALTGLNGGQVVGEDLAPGRANHRRAGRRAGEGL
eukprot:11907856-Alexandrium_andersonii.AAC.1